MVCAYAAVLALTEITLFKCFMLFHYRLAAHVNDDFIAAFLKLFNVLIALLFVLSMSWLNALFLAKAFPFLSGMFPSDR